MTSNITVRLAERRDLPSLARIANAANAKSIVHRRVAPNQDRFPTDYYRWRLNMVRERFAAPDLRTIVAEDSASSDVLGLATWAVEGSDTGLYKDWIGQSTWTDWLESKLLWVEKTWHRWIVDRSVDYNFVNAFYTASRESGRKTRPPCLHLYLIVVDPTMQSKGVGRRLIDWGQDLASREELPIFLESNLDATGFYDRCGFSRLTGDLIVNLGGQEPLRIPAYAWEGRQMEGRWLERDVYSEGSEARWKFKDDVLPK